jgi:hypothetical protein
MVARILTLWLAAASAAGCAPTDGTPNRAPPPPSDYPPGPYGYAPGGVMADLTLIGKNAPAPTDYGTLPLEPLSLGGLRQGATLLVIEGAARWCTFCQEDQPAMKQLAADYRSRGVVTLEIIAEGTYGVAATEDDINRWANAYELDGAIAIDPELTLARYADINAFPLYLVVRASTMAIEYLSTGSMAQAPLGPVLDGLLSR